MKFFNKLEGLFQVQTSSKAAYNPLNIVIINYGVLQKICTIAHISCSDKNSWIWIAICISTKIKCFFATGTSNPSENFIII